MAIFKIYDGVAIDYTNDGWTEYKKWLDGTHARLPFTCVDEGPAYDIIAFDGKVYRTCSITKPSTDATDFETNFKPNQRTNYLVAVGWNDPNVVHRLGNLTATSNNEVLVYGRTYTEPSSQAQRSVVSTSANDAYPAGSGARTVRVTFLNSDYALKTEDVNLNGTTPVNTVATDIRFIENIEVIAGAATVGAIKLMTLINGGGTEIAAISASAYNTQFAHHYVPVGKRCWILGWGAVIDDECRFKLYGQLRYGANLVNRCFGLYDLMGIATPPGKLDFYEVLWGVVAPEKSYIRVMVAPAQNTSTTVRAALDTYEESML
jgi:hypothetical protein